MGQAQQSLNSPAAQTVPQPQGLIDPSQHPIVGALIKLLSGAAQSYGWTSMPPQQRLEAQSLEQQKAETMARMAQTGAYEQGQIGVRQQLADTAADRAKSYSEDVQSKEEARKTSNEIRQQSVNLAQEKNNWQKDLAQGRLDQAKTRISNQAQQFEKTFQLRAKQVGIEQAKLELSEQGMGIKQGFLDLAKTALSQKGTTEGVQAIQKLQGLQFEHPILSQMFGLDDVSSMVGESKGAGLPGVGGAAPAVGAPAPLPNKVAAKKAQQTPANTFHYDTQGNRVAGP